MPRLENFSFCIRTEAFAEGEFTTDDLALGHLPSLQSVTVCHNCAKEESSGEEEVVMEREESNGEEEVVIMEVKEKLRHEADVHPNHPSIDIKAYSKWEL